MQKEKNKNRKPAQESTGDRTDVSVLIRTIVEDKHTWFGELSSDDITQFLNRWGTDTKGTENESHVCVFGVGNKKNFCLRIGMPSEVMDSLYALMEKHEDVRKLFVKVVTDFLYDRSKTSDITYKQDRSKTLS